MSFKSHMLLEFDMYIFDLKYRYWQTSIYCRVRSNPTRKCAVAVDHIIIKVLLQHKWKIQCICLFVTFKFLCHMHRLKTIENLLLHLNCDVKKWVLRLKFFYIFSLYQRQSESDCSYSQYSRVYNIKYLSIS